MRGPSGRRQPWPGGTRTHDLLCCEVEKKKGVGKKKKGRKTGFQVRKT
jgi:hypothetical protein